jgi:hypothetical protein
MILQIKRSINCLGAMLAVASVLVFGFSCGISKPPPDPLAGWHFCRLDSLDSNKAITDDYKRYIQSLSPEEQKLPLIHYFQDDRGQHAVEIVIGLRGADWHHILFYDKDNSRYKLIKYIRGNYKS